MAERAIVGYCRVSTDDQVSEGVSLEAQQQRIEAYGLAHGMPIIRIFTDAGISGKRADNRPGLQEALNLACRERAAIVVYSLSRLSRSINDTLKIAERLDKAGSDLVSLSERLDTTSAAGKMIFRMLAVLAEFERDLVAERTCAALAFKRSRREKTGGLVPYGFVLGEDGVTLLEREAEQAVISLMLSMHDRGASFPAIGAELERRGIQTKQGCRRWNRKTVARIVRRAIAELEKGEADRPNGLAAEAPALETRMFA